jgi:hypothetical protein
MFDLIETLEDHFAAEPDVFFDPATGRRRLTRPERLSAEEAARRQAEARAEQAEAENERLRRELEAIRRGQSGGG